MKKRVYYHLGLKTPLWALQLLLLLMIVLHSLTDDYVAEYSILECSQLLLIFMTMMMALKSYWNSSIPLDVRRCFLLVAFVALVLLARETSWGRFFYYDESYALTAEEKKLLKQLPLIKIVRYSMVIFAVLAVYYAIKHSLYGVIWNQVRKVKIYLIDILMIVIGVCAGIYSEEVLHNIKYEELSELGIYIAFFNICYRYGNNLDDCLALEEVEPSSAREASTRGD